MPLLESSGDDLARLREGLDQVRNPLSHPHPELGPHPQLAGNGLRLVALGGLGEIGRNMAVLETHGRLLIIDCGVLFPEDHHPGVDLILPDFSYLDGRLGDIEAIVLTHGHEDHIGAVPYVLARVARHTADRFPAHPRPGGGQAQGTPDHAVQPHREGRPARAARRLRPGVRRGQPLHPRRARRHGPHPGGGRCCTPATSRWTSCRSTAGSPTCGRSPGSVRRESTCSWSTRRTPRCPGSPRPSGTSPRRSTGCSGTPQRRIIVACFASHVHRVQQVLDAAAKAGRKVAMVGRSMVRNMGIAADLGYLHVPAGRARRRQAAGRAARRRDRAGLHRQPGRADGGAVPDGQSRPPDRRSGRATRSCSPARSSRATRTPSTESSTDSCGWERPWCIGATPASTSPGTRPRES